MRDDERDLEFETAQKETDFAMIEAWAKTVDLTDVWAFNLFLFEAFDRCLSLSFPAVTKRLLEIRARGLAVAAELVSVGVEHTG